MKDRIALDVDENQLRVQLHKIKEINEILANVGVDIEIEDSPESYSKSKRLKINFDTLESKKIKARGAGRPRKRIEKLIKVEEICRRMENETASQIAEELGISRGTLYRKLKEAKKYGYEYMM